MSIVPEPRTGALRGELFRVLGCGIERSLDDDEFDSLARRLFAFQFEANRPFAAYCKRSGRTPDAVAHWSEIPAVPAAAFAEVPLVAGPADRVEAVFSTSGTTRGTGSRGRHFMLDLSIYHASLLPSFAAHLLPDGARIAMFSLVPPLEEAPDSSLAHMVSVVMAEFAGGGRYFSSARTGIDADGLEAALRELQRTGEPVCLLGTAAAFIHWLDGLRERGVSYRLPAGSRLMDTGGFKGRGRDMPRDELRAAYSELLGLPAQHCVNEYGMTELCSQFYDGVLRDKLERVGPSPGLMRPPPWVRTQAVDPETLEPLPPGKTGLLRHFDLANIFSVIAVQTEDLGELVDDGFLLHGRASGALPRGCSIAMDLLLSAAERRNT